MVKDNQSGRSGGGIYFYLVSRAVFTDVTLENNRAANNGGGLGVGYGSQVELNRVTVYSNTAGFGGGIYYQNQYDTTRMELANVTIFSNTAQTTGGGLYLDYYYGTVVNLTANNVTLAYNKAITGGNVYNKQSNLELSNSIIVYGTPDNCAGDPTANITSGGYNLDSGTSCGLSGTGDLSSTAPQLATGLSDEGGKTNLLALQMGSPAVDAGNPAAPGSGNSACEITDQRLATRPQGSACDMGAYELDYHSRYLPLIFKE